MESLDEGKSEISAVRQQLIPANQKINPVGIPVENVGIFRRLNEKLQDTGCY